VCDYNDYDDNNINDYNTVFNTVNASFFYMKKFFFFKTKMNDEERREGIEKNY